MLLRSIPFGFLREENKGDAGGGGGAGGAGSEKPPADPGARMAALEKELGDYRRKEREAKETEERSKGEWNNVIKRYEKDLEDARGMTAAEKKRADELDAQIQSHAKAKREGDFTEALAKHLGINVSPRLRGLLPQTGLDTAPEKLDAEHVKKVAAKVRELDPDLKPGAKPIGNGGGGAPVGAGGEIDYVQLGRDLAAGKL
jgi:hypothetical protein